MKMMESVGEKHKTTGTLSFMKSHNKKYLQQKMQQIQKTSVNYSVHH